LIESLSWGALFAVAGRGVCHAVSHYAPGGGALESGWQSVFPASQFAYSGTAALTLALGVALPVAVNAVVDKETAYLKTALRYGDELLQLFLQSAQIQEPVIITLDSRKVYVGYVTVSPTFREQDAYVVLLPALTGYRAQETLQVHLEVDYISLWTADKSLEEKFKTVIPVASIKAAHIFDDGISQSDLAAVPAPQADGGGSLPE